MLVIALSLAAWTPAWRSGNDIHTFPRATAALSDSFWDKIRYGQRGKPAPPAPPAAAAPPLTLRAVFDQLDSNGDGLLQRVELLRVSCPPKKILSCCTIVHSH